MILRAARVLFIGGLVAAVAVPACGGSSDDSSSASHGGSGGSAGSAGAAGNTNPPVACGVSSCKGVTIALQGAPSLDIPACCADEASGQCGLDSSFLATFGPTFPVACQPLNQPGTMDKTCPASTKTPVTGTAFSIQFLGCCRENGTCGYELDKLGGLFQLGLGCVDSTPFLDGGSPQTCGDVGGAGGDGPTGSAGASTNGGAAGESASGGAAGH